MRKRSWVAAAATLATATAVVGPAQAATKKTVAPQTANANNAQRKCTKVGGNFVDNQLLASGDFQHADPGLNTELIGAVVSSSVFDGISRLDFSDGQIKPNVAESWKTSADGLTWTFKIRKGVTFSNGEPVLPSTFKASWDRNVAPSFASEYAGLAEVIAGYKEVQAGTSKELQTTADDANMNLTVKTVAPYGLLPARLSHNFFYPLPKEAIAMGKDWENKGTIIGNGAFKVDKREKDQFIRLVRNDSYFGGIYGGKACLDSLTFKVSKDPQSAYNDFEAGNSQNAIIPVGKFSEATGKYGDQAARPYLSVNYIVFNAKNPVVGGASGALLRSAIGNAIDRNALNKIVYDNSREVATGVTPPGVPGYKAKLSKNFQTGAANVKLAKQQIDQYKKAKGSVPTVNLWYRNNSTESTIAQLIQANAKAIGVDIKLEPQPPVGYFSSVRTNNPQMALAGWAWDYPGYDNGMNELFHSKEDFNTSNNLADFTNPKFDALTDQGLSEPDPVKQARLYNQAEGVLLDSGIVIPTFWARFQHVTAASVGNYPQTALGFVDWALVSLK